jgi:hypothetical protein
VEPLYCRQGLALRYSRPLEAGHQRAYRALICEARRGAAIDTAPWQLVLDEYKRWLKGHMHAEGLYPIDYPMWLLDCHGWLNVQLENMPVFDVRRVRELWLRWKHLFPWVQFWGQMSNYGGPAHLTRPRRAPGEETGCCLDRSEMHRRYKPQLIELVHEITREGHAGYYSRPRDPYERLDLSDPADEDSDAGFLYGWLDRNRREYGANAFHIDVLGARFFGAPLEIARMLKEGSPNTTIEFGVDVYPAANVISGALGCGEWAGGPGRTLDRLGRGLTKTTFPAFGRYLLDDRVVFLGQSNGDHRFWGRENEYWTERQAFLLGAKFDVITPAESNQIPTVLNRALRLSIEERERTRWWQRRPRYRHQMGIGAVPPMIDVRRFVGNDGEDLLVFDNWGQRVGERIRFEGRWISVPSRPLSILVLSESGLERD